MKDESPKSWYRSPEFEKKMADLQSDQALAKAFREARESEEARKGKWNRKPSDDCGCMKCRDNPPCFHKVGWCTCREFFRFKAPDEPVVMKRDEATGSYVDPIDGVPMGEPLTTVLGRKHKTPESQTYTTICKHGVKPAYCSYCKKPVEKINANGIGDTLSALIRGLKL